MMASGINDLGHLDIWNKVSVNNSVLVYAVVNCGTCDILKLECKIIC